MTELRKIDYNPFSEEREIEQLVNAGEAQKEIWLSCALGGNESSLAYNESVSLRLSGPFDAAHFAQAAADVVQSHEALRAVFSTDGETMLIYRKVAVEVPLTDLSGVPDQPAVLKAFIQAEMLNAFDLGNGPLFRFFLHRLDENTHYFTLVLHHIIADGWSTGVILKDLSLAYNARLKGEKNPAATAQQISEYARLQAQHHQSAEFEQIKNYWTDLYQDGAPVLHLPTDFPRPALRTYKSERIDHSVSPALLEKIRYTGAKSGCSLVNTLLSAFEIFIYLQTNQRRLVVGLPAAGQAHTGLTGLVGHCVNLLAISTKVDPGYTFQEYLTLRKGPFYDAFDNQAYTFGQLIKNLSLSRDPSRIPLAPVVLNIDMGMDDGVKFDQLDHQLISNPRAYETFEIFLNITGSAASCVFEWSYNTQLFKPESILKMAEDFERLLQVMAGHPEQTIQSFSIDRHKPWKNLLEEWNNTFVPLPEETSFTLLTDSMAALYPDKTALSFKSEKMSYQRLKIWSDQFAGLLIGKGVQKGDIIGLAVQRSPAMVACLLGIAKAGAVYLPLDPEYPKDRIEFMLTDARARLLVVSEAYRGKFSTLTEELTVESIRKQLGAQQQVQLPALQREDLAYILYTSGSTGMPKGVCIQHGNLLNLLLSLQQQPGITPQDKMAALTTISFDIAAVELFLPLITGAEVVIYDRNTASDGRLLLDILKERRITIMQATPVTWKMIIEAGWKSPLPLKVFCGGEAMSRALAADLLDRAAAVWNMYGPTETTIYSVIQQVRKTDTTITIGRPIANTRVYVLDEDREQLPPGQTGELYIGGAGVAKGYLNRPELTAERFIPDTFSKEEGALLYRTGDLARFMDNGELNYLGRADHQVKIRGFRIEPGEIEHLLTAQPGVKQAVVVPAADQSSLLAYIVADTHFAPAEALLIKACKDALRRKLPGFMVPSGFYFLAQLPLTPNRKVDRKALSQQKPADRLKQVKHTPAKTESELMLVRIWSAVLGTTEMGIDEDFFELGGHSMLAVRVMLAIEQETGVRLPLATLFKNPTIRKLARRIHSIEQEESDILIPIKPSGTKDPLYLVHGGGLNVLLFATISKYMDKEQPVYGLQALGLNKPVPLLSAIEEIAAVYNKEILLSNPDGPYALAGYSMGGKIAFEMAIQLQAMGKRVKFLGVMDTYAANIDTDGAFRRFVRKLNRQFRKLPYFVKSFAQYPAEAWNYQWTMLRSRFSNSFQDPAADEYQHFTPYEHEIQNSYDQASQHYMLKPAALKIDLFRVEKRLYFLDDPVCMGWKEFAKLGVAIHQVPGDHRTFLLPPNDEHFARILQRELDKN